MDNNEPVSSHDAESLATTRVHTKGRTKRSPSGLPEGTKIGRFVILSQLGAGAMGVVYSAYDPELDRKVALKLLRPGLSSRTDDSSVIARKRLLREAQALAKLAHPNVVAIHDVGLHRANVWLAMEFIDGMTFRKWMGQPHAWQEVVAKMMAAGRGLAAAHQAKLMHRDFKPDNIMVGHDGRVRVMDLGLARASDEVEPLPIELEGEINNSTDSALLSANVTRAGAVLGTPTYMAPEQLKSESCDARSDIFAFCVTLWESLYGKRPFASPTFMRLTTNIVKGNIQEPPSGRRVPGWLRRACLKGLASDPDRRWATMSELLETLEKGLAQSRWWRVGVALFAVLVCAGGAVAIHQLNILQTRAECRSEGGRIDTVWNHDVRTQLREGLLATGSPIAESTFHKVTPYLDDHADEWKAVRSEICITNKVEKTWDSDQTAKATWCLEERQIAFEEFVTRVIASDLNSINRTVDAASKLRKPRPCADPFYLHTIPPPPDDPDSIRPVMQKVMRANAIRSSGNYAKANRLAVEAKASSESLNWPPLVAQASWTLGMSLMQLGKHAQAEEAFEEAYFQAATIEAHEIATAAGISLMEVVGLRLTRHDDGMRWWRLTEVSMVHLDPHSKRIRRGYALDVVAGIYYQKGLYEQSKASLEESLALRLEAVGEEHPSYSNGLNNLALVHLALANHKKAVELGQRALALKQKIHGKNHPNVANSLATVGSFLVFEGEFTQAKKHLQQALKLQQTGIGRDSPHLISTLNHLALVHHALGEEQQAIAGLERALAISHQAFGPNHIREAEIIESLALVEIDLKAYTQAQARLEHVLDLRKESLEPEDPSIGETQNNLGSLLLLTDLPDQAQEQFAAALKIWKNVLGPEHPRLANAWIGLAKVALRQNQPAQALKLARQAMQRLESSHARPIEIAAAKWQLAQALWLHGAVGNRNEVLTLLNQARHLYERVGGKHVPITEINSLLKQVRRR